MNALLLTPPGAAAIAVVRLVGQGVQDFLARHFSGTPRVGRAVHGELRDDTGRTVDDPVVVLVDAQTADLNVHGGPWVVSEVLELAARAGFTKAEHTPEAFARHSSAVDADTPLWQEVLSALPQARTEQAVRMLLAQPAAWERLLTASPDRTTIEAVLQDPTLTRLLSTPRVAIVGPANAGKSTLANRLFGTERSITADLPGTTRDWVGELANLSGVAVMLVDTPGLRDSDDAIEQQAIRSAGDQVGRADVVVLVFDAGRPFDHEQQSALDRFPSAIIAVNKADAPAAWPTDSQLSEGAIRLSARSGEGVDRLVSAILSRLGCVDLSSDRPRCWTERQAAQLRQLLKDEPTS